MANSKAMTLACQAVEHELGRTGSLHMYEQGTTFWHTGVVDPERLVKAILAAFVQDPMAKPSAPIIDPDDEVLEMHNPGKGEPGYRGPSG